MELYQHSYYRGIKHVYTDSGNLRRNDDMSSLKVPKGCCVIVYENSNYEGRSHKFCQITTFVGGVWNDKVSSIEIQVSGENQYLTI